MGVLDKIKNALFEVEYVEVEEPPKKEKKEKIKKEKHDRHEEHEDKPIAKKIVLPGKREEKVEEIKEEELLDEDFEIRPKDEEKAKEEFKFMDDNDFKVDDGPEYLVEEEYEEPQIIEDKPIYEEPTYTNTTSNNVYNNPNYSSNNLYGRNNSYDVPVHQYGTYEKEVKTYFKPSPIISPIYGILDKNYRKEDVVQKKEVHLTSSYARGNVSIEDVRKKAYGSLSDDIEREIEEDINEEVKEEKPELVEEVAEEENVLVDLSEEQDKPFVKDVTMGDALEYYSDLGLEYNVDYMDASKEKSTSKKVKEEPEVEEKQEELKEEEPIEEEKKEKVVEEEPKEEVQEIEEEKKEENEVLDADDNLFDLIDSMYQEE